MRWIYGGIAVVFVILITAGSFFYQSEAASARRKVHDNLEVVSALKVAQITQWRRELLGDAADIASQPHMADAVARWLKQPNAGDLSLITSSLKILQRRANLNDAMVVDTTGQLRMNLVGAIDGLDTVDHEAVADTLKVRRPTLTGMHRYELEPDVHVDAIAPLIASSGEVVGAVVLEIKADDFLFPMLQSWPTSSTSSETLLVRRSGDSVEFLNATRYQPDAALRLRIPLTRTEVPAVSAVLGREGIFEGTDYRGEPVLSVLRPIPGSPWFLVTKVDIAEAYAEWNARSRLLLLLMATLSLATVAGIFWLRRSAASYRELSRAEADLRDYQAHLEETVAARTRELKERNELLAVEVLERQRAESELLMANQRLEGLAEERAAHLRELAGELTRAEQHERDKLYELLHDEVQPLLVAARLALSGINEGSCNQSCVRIASDTRDHISKVITTARTLSTELSPPLIRERGLGPALESLSRLMTSQYGLAVDFACDPDAEPADMATRLLCFNAARELLINVVKHANTGSVEINLQLERPDLLRLSVIDRGQGFDAKESALRGGSGLLSVERRLRMIGGRLTIDSSPGQGTIATLWAPIGPADEGWMGNDRRHSGR
jgi:signal transduction histidine kinase